MNRDISNAPYNSLITLILLVSVHPLIPFAGYNLVTNLLVFMFFSVPGIFLSKDKKYIFKYLLLLFLAFCFIQLSMNFIDQVCKIKLCFEQISVNQLTGYVVYDSSFSQNKNHIMTVLIKQCSNVFGQSGSCSGLVTVVSKTSHIITSSIKVSVNGHFSDSLFICDSLQVLNRSFVNDLRESIITFLEKRLLPNNSTQSSVLSMMLLLGRAETYNSQVKTLASQCGCMHVLALSGMHLNVVTYVTKPIKKNWLKYTLSNLLAICFIFIAGPRPSLIRATLMLMFSFVYIKERILLAMIVQIIIFPFSLINIGSMYSYAAVFALVCLSPYLSNTISVFLGKKLGRIVGSSISVLAVTTPLMLIFNGQWYPFSIIAGPVASFLAVFSMAIGVLLIIFGHVPVLVYANNAVYNAMIKTFSMCTSSESSGLTEYYIFLLSVALIFIVPTLIHRHLNKESNVDIIKIDVEL